MMRYAKLLLVFFSFVILSLATNAQNLSTIIKVQAMDLGTAWLKNDFTSFVKYMHPDVITLAGGKDSMKMKMDSAYAAMKRFHVKVKRYWIGNPGEIVRYKNQLQAVLPMSTTLEMSLGEMTVETSTIVLSNDNGKNWWFIDTNLYKVEKLKNASIDISPALVIPPQTKPKILPKKAVKKS